MAAMPSQVSISSDPSTLIDTRSGDARQSAAGAGLRFGQLGPVRASNWGGCGGWIGPGLRAAERVESV